MSVIAVEGQENNIKLILMTEIAEYMKLIRDQSSISEFIAMNDSSLQSRRRVLLNVNNDFTAIIVEEIGDDCLSNKGYICTQLWSVEGLSETDLSGIYGLTFTTQCIPGHQYYDHCIEWLSNHPDIANDAANHDNDTTDNPVSLTTELVWKNEIRDPLVFVLKFGAEMLFYEDDTYIDGDNVDTSSYLYQIGEDEVFVEVRTDFPDDTLDIFDTEIVNVWICTFPPDIDPPTTSDGTENGLTSMGCFNSQRDTEYDQFFYHIHEDGATTTQSHGYTDHSSFGISNFDRFSFIVPSQVARDRLYVHVQVMVDLQDSSSGRRRRVLLDVTNGPNTANQMRHFGDQIGINHGQNPKARINNEPEEPNGYDPNAVNNPSTASISLSSPWIIAIGTLLGLVLILNIIFMCYINCNGEKGRVFFERRKGYSSVKRVDSEDFDESEANPINVVSE